MRRAPIALALLLCACSSQPTDEIGAGDYSGSTASETAVRISVGGSAILVNDRKTVLDSVVDNRRFTVKKEPEQTATFVDKSRWACRPVLEGEELLCTVTWADGQSEMIELMKE